MKQLFVCEESIVLNALVVDELFRVNFTEEGSNRHRLELRTHLYWRDFLQDLEGIIIQH